MKNKSNLFECEFVYTLSTFGRSNTTTAIKGEKNGDGKWSFVKARDDFSYILSHALKDPKEVSIRIWTQPYWMETKLPFILFISVSHWYFCFLLAFIWFGCHFWRTLNIFQIEMKQRFNALLVVDGSGKLINRIKVVQYKYCDTGQNWSLQTMLIKSEILLILAGCEKPGNIFYLTNILPVLHYYLEIIECLYKTIDGIQRMAFTNSLSAVRILIWGEREKEQQVDSCFGRFEKFDENRVTTMAFLTENILLLSVNNQRRNK